jgi:hypothetical protein
MRACIRNGAESFCKLKLPHLAQSLHLGEVFLLERKSYESLSFPIVSNPMSSPFPAIRRLVLISRLRVTKASGREKRVSRY